MSILNSIISGLGRSLKAWKWALVVWLSTLILVALPVLPLRSGINNIMASSMITEKLKDGINLDVLANSGTGLSVLFAFFGSGLFLVIFFGIILSIFLSGGIFTILRNQNEKNGSKQFFGGAASNFWPYLIITMITYLILIFLSLIIIGIPLMIVQGSGSETASIKTALITGSVMALICPVLLLTADYARAWQAGSESRNAFRAIGKGFSQTFSHFLSSYPVMAVIMILQLIITFISLKFISGFTPATGSGIFLLFILSQVLYIIKIHLKIWRYGSVTAMYEKHP